MKDKLEAKLQEVNALVQELGTLPGKRESGRKKSFAVVEMARSPNGGDWKNRQTIGGVLGGGEQQEGRLPAIMEDKLYPRRTLENAEMLALRANAEQRAAESPDLGPPPVAHFDVPEPINFSTDTAPGIEQGHGRNEEALPLPSNLETRRKRRTSSLLRDMSVLEPMDAELQQQPQSLLKTGAKRKLDTSDLEESVVHHASENDDFVFQRAALGTLNKTNTSTRFARQGRQTTQSTDSIVALPLQKTAELSRKVLAPKSTNSPTKRRTQELDKPNSNNEPDTADKPTKPSTRVKIRSNHPKQNPESFKADTIDPYNEAEAQDPPPKTPAAGLNDMLSPTSTQPSTRAAPTREAAITHSVEDVLNGSIGRGASRRVRAAVSYAEPNLRDKMRRPGKELVGAVEGVKAVRDVSQRTERDNSQGLETNVKSERMEEDAKWQFLPMAVDDKKMEPASPLGGKEKRMPRDKGPHPHTDTDQCIVLSEDLDKAVEGLSIFDQPVSSPAETETSSMTTSRSTKGKAQVPTQAHSRRHSVQHSSSASSTGGRQSISRPSSAASLRNQNPSKQNDLKQLSSIGTLQRSGDGPLPSQAHATNTPSTSSSSTRIDRAASRRRSMMV